MGIYDSGLNIDFGPDLQKKIMYGGAALLVVLVIAAAGLMVSDAVSPRALLVRFDKNPIKAGETTRIFVSITNTGKSDEINVPITLEAKEKTEFDVFPINEKFKGQIESISPGNSREITFMVNPIGKIIPGTYTFVSKAKMGMKEYSQEAVLKVEQ